MWKKTVPASTHLYPSAFSARQCLVQKPPFLRSSFVRRPPFVRRRANKRWPYRRTTGPHPYPSFPLDEFLQLLLIALAKLVTEGLYKIGQLVLVTARFGRKIVNLVPKDPQFRPGYRYANSLRWVPRRGKSIIKWGHRRVLVAIGVVFWMTTVTHRTLAARTLCPWPYRILLLYCSL